VKAGPLLDLTGMASDKMFEQCVDVLLVSNSVDALCISIVPQASDIHTTDEEMERCEENVAVRIVRTAHAHGKPVVLSANVVSGAGASYNRFGQVLEKGGIPTFFTAERAMVCLNEFMRYHLIRKKHLLSEWLK
jgi:acyl-CoA synthetase (NDP forming)